MQKTKRKLLHSPVFCIPSSMDCANVDLKTLAYVTELLDSGQNAKSYI